jgi:acetyltransferase-like isoleucine patch superfamily enzyme
VALSAPRFSAPEDTRCGHIVSMTPLKRILKLLRGWLIRKFSRTRIKGLRGNVLHLSDARLHRCCIEFFGQGNVVEIGHDAILHETKITVIGTGHRVMIANHTRFRAGGTIVVEDHGSEVVVQQFTTMTSPTIVCSEGGRILIGEDCMIAMQTCIRNSDGHSIIDTGSGQRINCAADVVIGNHVWLGIGSLIFKGANLGDGAIVGAKAVVTKTIPSGCLAVGSPARVVRENIAWTRERSTETTPPFAGVEEKADCPADAGGSHLA